MLYLSSENLFDLATQIPPQCSQLAISLLWVATSPLYQEYLSIFPRIYVLTQNQFNHHVNERQTKYTKLDISRPLAIERIFETFYPKDPETNYPIPILFAVPFQSGDIYSVTDASGICFTNVYYILSKGKLVVHNVGEFERKKQGYVEFQHERMTLLDIFVRLLKKLPTNENWYLALRERQYVEENSLRQMVENTTPPLPLLDDVVVCKSKKSITLQAENKQYMIRFSKTFSSSSSSFANTISSTVIWNDSSAPISRDTRYPKTNRSTVAWNTRI